MNTNNTSPCPTRSSFLRPLLLLLLLANGGLSASGGTLLVHTTLDVWHMSPGNPWSGPEWQLRGYDDVKLGDPFSVRIVIDESLITIGNTTDPQIFNGAVTSFEFLLGGQPKIVIRNGNLTLRNNYSNVDTLHLTIPIGILSEVDGLDNWAPRGNYTVNFTDRSATALQPGSPINFAAFFDSPTDVFRAGVSFTTANPYAGSGPSLFARGSGHTGFRLLSAEEPNAVPEGGATTCLIALASIPLLWCRRNTRRS